MLFRSDNYASVVGRAFAISAHLENDAIGRARRGGKMDIDALYEFYRKIRGLPKQLNVSMLQAEAEKHGLPSSICMAQEALRANLRGGKASEIDSLPLPKIFAICFEGYENSGHQIIEAILDSRPFPTSTTVRKALVSRMVGDYKKHYSW